MKNPIAAAIVVASGVLIAVLLTTREPRDAASDIVAAPEDQATDDAPSLVSTGDRATRDAPVVSTSVSAARTGEDGSPSIRAEDLIERIGIGYEDAPVISGGSLSRSLESIRSRVLESGVRTEEIAEALRDPEASDHARALLHLAAIWSDDGDGFALVDHLDPIDWEGLRTAEQTLVGDPRPLAHSKLLALMLRGEPAGRIGLEGLTVDDAMRAFDEWTPQRNTLILALMASGSESSTAREVAERVLAERPEVMAAADAAWRSIARDDVERVISASLSDDPSARNALIESGSTSAGTPEATAFLELVQREATDVATGHFLGRGMRATLAAADAAMLEDVFRRLESSVSTSERWLRRGLEDANACTAIGEVLVSSADPTSTARRAASQKDLLSLATRVTRRLKKGQMSRREEELTLSSVAAAARGLPDASEELAAAVELLALSRDRGHRALATSLRGRL